MEPTKRAIQNTLIDLLKRVKALEDNNDSEIVAARKINIQDKRGESRRRAEIDWLANAVPIINYDIAFRVWYIGTFKQWIVHPPDGTFRSGEFVYLTNIHPLYYRKQCDAWEIAKQHAKKYRTLAILIGKTGTETCHDYREAVDKDEKVQATKHPKYIHPRPRLHDRGGRS